MVAIREQDRHGSEVNNNSEDKLSLALARLTLDAHGGRKKEAFISAQTVRLAAPAPCRYHKTSRISLKVLIR